MRVQQLATWMLVGTLGLVGLAGCEVDVNDSTPDVEVTPPADVDADVKVDVDK